MPELFPPSFLKKLEMLTLISKQLFRGDTRGDRRSSAHGASVEFADFRPYVQGDDFRRIDWNAFAKFENLMLRLFVEEQELSVQILLDTSASMNFGSPNKFDYARRLAAALAYIALANTDRVTFTPIALHPETDELLGPTTASIRGKPGIVRLMSLLENLKPQGNTNLNASLSRFALRTSRPGLTIIISDFFSDAGYEEGVKKLRYAHHEIVLIQTLAPDEINPDLMADVRLVDMETHVGIDVTANKNTLQAYSKRLQLFLRDIQNFVHTHSANHVLANTQTSFEDLIFAPIPIIGIGEIVAAVVDPQPIKHNI